MKLISFQLKKFSLVTLFFATSLYARATTSSKVSKEEAAQASAHVLKIIREGKCHLPSPRIIKIQDLFTDNRRRFLPSCTIIHVCGDDTGCCDHDDMKCAPLKQEVVTLYFWVLEMTDRGHKRSVESITIKNDTECSCQSMSSPTNETWVTIYRRHNLSWHNPWNQQLEEGVRHIDRVAIVGDIKPHVHVWRTCPGDINSIYSYKYMSTDTTN